MLVDALREASVDVVESWMYSISWNVCNVASAANETLRLAKDLRRASLAAACCSSSVRTAIFDIVGSSPKLGVDLPLLTSELSESWLFRVVSSGKTDTLGLRIDRGAASDYFSSVKSKVKLG